jgi:hypothetical protein
MLRAMSGAGLQIPAGIKARLAFFFGRNGRKGMVPETIVVFLSKAYYSLYIYCGLIREAGQNSKGRMNGPEPQRQKPRQ